MDLFLLFILVSSCHCTSSFCRFFDCFSGCCGRRTEPDSADLSSSLVNESSTIPQEPIRFITFGDWGEMGAANVLQKIGAYIRSPPSTRQAVFLLGDNIYPFGVSHVRGIADHKFELFSTHLAGTRDRSTQYYVVAGNHDHMGDLKAQTLYHDKDPRWNMIQEIELEIFPVAIGKYVCIWMFDGLAINRVLPKLRVSLAHEKRRCHWRILASHYPIYTEGGYKGEEFTLKLRHLLQPILDTFRVHLYLSAHEHSSQVLIGRKSRTVHLIAGASVGVRYDLRRKGDRESDGPYDFVWGNARIYPVILQLDVSEHVLTYQFVHLLASDPLNATEGSVPPTEILFRDSITHTGS